MLIKSYGKILLFGEYSILTGSDALIIPFYKFWGTMKIADNTLQRTRDKWSNHELDKFCSYLLSIDRISVLPLDLQRLTKDIQSGLFFDSSIPHGSGFGSSGALIASIFHSFGKPAINRLSLQQLKDLLARVEDYFHEKSSGIDPLCIFEGKALLLQADTISVLELERMPALLKNLYVLNTRFTSKTSDLILNFKSLSLDASFNCGYTIYQSVVNDAVQCLLRDSINDFEECMFYISKFQYTQFKEMIPPDLRDTWKQGISERKYFFKLCGSGGGSLIVYSTEKKEDLDKIFNTTLYHILEA